MNFNYFYKLHERTDFDEIKVIGKEVEKEGRLYYILGMTRKERRASLYVLEMAADVKKEKEECIPQGTPRESLKSNMSRKKQSFFMHVRELQCAGKSYEMAGATSGLLKYNDPYETCILFLRMREAGWKVSEESLFYDADWDSLAVTNMELRGDWDSLPEWTENMQVLADIMPEENAIEIPVVLECGKTNVLEFKLADGSTAVCYINKVDTMDVWEEEEKKFADSAYRERMLQHVTQEELEEMQQHLFETLEQQCPRGKCYMVVEYECTKELSLNFFDREYLDTVPTPKKGSAASVLMMYKPDAETGVHGLKLRGCVIQKPLEQEERTLEAELFSYSGKIEKRVEGI